MWVWSEVAGGDNMRYEMVGGDEEYADIECVSREIKFSYLLEFSYLRHPKEFRIFGILQIFVS